MGTADHPVMQSCFDAHGFERPNLALTSSYLSSSSIALIHTIHEKTLADMVNPGAPSSDFAFYWKAGHFWRAFQSIRALFLFVCFCKTPVMGLLAPWRAIFGSILMECADALAPYLAYLSRYLRSLMAIKKG